ncbi:MAG: leucine-rich repeat protein [Treponematales bacterium]
MVIHEEIEGFPVRTILNGAFLGNKTMKSLFIPKSVTKIKLEFFFPYLNGSTRFLLHLYKEGRTPENAYPEAAFGEALAAFTVDSENPAYFSQNGVLYDKPVTRIVFVPPKLSGAVTIPNGITTIDASVRTAGDSGHEIPFSSRHIPFNGRKDITSVVIPDTVAGILCKAFQGCTGLTSLVIPDNVTRIYGGAFADLHEHYFRYHSACRAMVAAL